LIKKEKFDVIHIHGDWSSLIFAKIIKKLTKAKIIVFSIHGQLTRKFTHQKLLPKLIKNVDLIFSTGYDTGKKLEKLSGKKVIVQPSGIDEIFFEPFEKKFTNKNFTVITVANLFPKKNLELVLEIAKQMKDIKFIIIGDGPCRNNLENKKEKESIYNVELLGFKSPKEIKNFYQNSDCFLLTSLAEGTPTSALEAMACGLPIISSNAGGLEHIIRDYENGFVINNFDKYKYIEKIKLLKNDIDLRKKIFFNNKKLAQNYKWEVVAKNITDQIKKVLSEKN
jgi:glycosyltransferase involved in cell wall biosynthesis